MNKWLIQKNIWNEYGYERFIQSMHDNDVDFEEVHVIPFTDTFDKEIDFTPTQIFGSGRFVNICRDRGFNTYKSFKPFEDFYTKHDWINGDGEDMTMGDFRDNYNVDYPVFIKPYTEKFFTGLVIDNNEDKEKIQLASSFIEDENAEIIRISPFKAIFQEARFYIINGEIITGSIYKVNGIGHHKKLDKDHPAWEQCKNILAGGFIDDAFVIDLGCLENTQYLSKPYNWKIVELNNINSSGLYECDTDVIVRAFKYLK